MKNLMKAFSSHFKHLRVRVFFRMVLKKVTWGFLLTVSVSLSLFLITTQFTQPVSLLSFTVTFILQTINRRMIFIDSAALFEPPSSDWSFAPPQIAVFLTNLRPSLLLTLVRIIVFSFFPLLLLIMFLCDSFFFSNWLLSFIYHIRHQSLSLISLLLFARCYMNLNYLFELSFIFFIVMLWRLCFFSCSEDKIQTAGASATRPPLKGLVGVCHFAKFKFLSLLLSL